MEKLLFKESLKRLRKERGMNQSELADKLGVSRTTVTTWEKGDALPSLDRIVEIASVLDVDLITLLGREDVFLKDDLLSEYSEQIDYLEKFRAQMVRRGFENYEDKSIFELADLISGILEVLNRKN